MYGIRRTIAPSITRNEWFFDEKFHVDIRAQPGRPGGQADRPEEMSLGDMMTLLKLR